jgi:hypothetical protein
MVTTAITPRHLYRCLHLQDFYHKYRCFADNGF